MKLFLQANRILFFLGLSLPLLALLTIGWLVNNTSSQFRESFYQVAETYKTLNLVEQTQLHLLDAETERRGYLLAGGADYLDSYGKAMEFIQEDIQQLQGLVGHIPNQQTNIMELQNLVTVRLGLDPEKMAAGATNLPDMLAISLTDEGKTTMDHINRVLFQMREDEESSLDLRQQHAESEAISSQITTVILICTVAVALLFIIFIVVRLEKLQQVVTICAWTGQVKFGGEWIRLEEYLKKRFGISVSHGLSKEAAEKIAREIEVAKGPDTGPSTGA
ncbi:MAG TPA: CHASE3 domain-containing protein [Candidatus Baltobacteraceae bacterium]|nr:CHASE3 domain-containing protein [Candidatus Baltobacteraceae bacterium]